MKIAVLYGGASLHDLSNYGNFDLIYVDSLHYECSLQQSGHTARYIYRDVAAFSSAVSAATEWLQLFLQAVEHWEGGCLFWRDKYPDWVFFFDSIFEAKGGIFDCVYHHMLARAIGERNEHIIITCGPDSHILSRALREEASSQTIHLSFLPDVPSRKIPEGRGLSKRVFQLADRLISSLTLDVTKLARQRNRARSVFLFSPGGAMLNTRGSSGAADVYTPGLANTLSAELTAFGQIFLNLSMPGRISFAAAFRKWGDIASGRQKEWYAYASLRSIVRLGLDRRRFQKRWSELSTKPSFRELFHIAGINFWSSAESTLTAMIPTQAASARFHLSISRRFVRLENVGVVVSVEAYSNLGRALAFALSETGGKLVGLQGGIISQEKATNIGFYTPAFASPQQLLPDKFFVWGARYREILTTYGVDDSTVKIAGFGRNVTESEGFSFSGCKEVLYVAGGNQDVCPYLMTQEEEDFTIRSLIRHKPSGVNLTIRTHPRQDSERFYALYHGKGVDVCHPRDMDLGEQINRASIIFGKASTVLLEAAARGKQIVLLNLAGTPEFTGFSKGAGSPPYVQTEDQLKEVLDKIVQGLPMEWDSEAFKEGWANGTVSDLNCAVVKNVRAIIENEKS